MKETERDADTLLYHIQFRKCTTQNVCISSVCVCIVLSQTQANVGHAFENNRKTWQSCVLQPGSTEPITSKWCKEQLSYCKTSF